VGKVLLLSHHFSSLCPSGSARQSDGFVNRWSGVQIPPGAPLNLFPMKKLHQKDSDSAQDSGLMVLYDSKKIESIRKFLMVDRQLTPRTVQSHIALLKKFLEDYDGAELTKEDVQDYLSKFNNSSTYRNNLSMLKVYLRDYEKHPELVEGFRFPRVQFSPKSTPSKQTLQRFYLAIKQPKDRAMFLMFATSGLRRHEVLDLRAEDIDIDRRTIQPKAASVGATKHTWVSFFNEEAASALVEDLEDRSYNGAMLFPQENGSLKKIWADARAETKSEITPQDLRFWFANEMARLGVPDRFIDAYQGRVPRSVLARHYSDYSLENLKGIYEKAGLKVLA